MDNKTTFTRKQLVAFGNYLLSEERRKLNSEDIVSHADVENFLDSQVSAPSPEGEDETLQEINQALKALVYAKEKISEMRNSYAGLGGIEHSVKISHMALESAQATIKEQEQRIKELEAEVERLKQSSVVDDETASEPITSALYATGRFTTDQCDDLAEGIIQYIKDYGLSVTKQSSTPSSGMSEEEIEKLAEDTYPIYPIEKHLIENLSWSGYINHLRIAYKNGCRAALKTPPSPAPEREGIAWCPQCNMPGSPVFGPKCAAPDCYYSTTPALQQEEAPSVDDRIVYVSVSVEEYFANYAQQNIAGYIISDECALKPVKLSSLINPPQQKGGGE